MRKHAFLLCLFFYTGCEQTPCEGEMSRCYTPHERITVSWVNGSTATLANNNGAACIALGSSDTSGGVKLTPRRLQPGYSGLKPILVTPGKPFLGFLEGTIDVTPIATVPVGASSTFPETQVLDLIAYESEPPFKPERAAYAYDGVPTAAAIYLPVRGRKRIHGVVVSSASVSNAVLGWRVVNGTLTYVDGVTKTGTQVDWQPQVGFNRTDQTNFPPVYGTTLFSGVDVIDYISLECGGTWVRASLEAYDE